MGILPCCWDHTSSGQGKKFLSLWVLGPHPAIDAIAATSTTGLLISPSQREFVKKRIYFTISQGPLFLLFGWTRNRHFLLELFLLASSAQFLVSVKIRSNQGKRNEKLTTGSMIHYFLLSFLNPPTAITLQSPQIVALCIFSKVFNWIQTGWILLIQSWQ